MFDRESEKITMKEYAYWVMYPKMQLLLNGNCVVSVDAKWSEWG